MSGWDRDTQGDYTPPPTPGWIWALVAAVVLGFAALAAFAS
jgi:hypothetical protein